MTAEWQGFIISLLSIEEKYASPYMVYPPEGHTYLHHILLNYNTAEKLAFNKAIA